MGAILSRGSIGIRPTRNCRECSTARFYGQRLSERLFVSIDTHEAEQIPGVTVARDGNFVGVVAPSAEIASRAVAAIRAEWKAEPQPSNKELFEYLKKNATEGKDPTGDASRYEAGSVEKALASADHRLQQTYTVSYIAHAPLEPRAALAQWAGDNLTVWTGTQRPFGVRSELAEAFRIPEESVRVLMPDTGSGYGGKHTGEAAIEAARLARAAKRPVKLVWTREEEFTWAYFRPAGVIEVSSGLRGDGTIAAWEFHNYNSGAAGIRTYYDIANQRIEFHPSRSPLRQGSYRALAATANHFARESFMDELAHRVNMDPLEFRLKNLKNERLRAVFEAAAKKFGWGQRESRRPWLRNGRRIREGWKHRDLRRGHGRSKRRRSQGVARAVGFRMWRHRQPRQPAESD